jgi:hypothetical protein
MCAVMINPALSFLFDLFLIGSASTIIAGMVQEYLASRPISVGSTGRGHVPQIQQPSAVHQAHLRSSAHRQTLRHVA